jgi:hypothetical protein
MLQDNAIEQSLCTQSHYSLKSSRALVKLIESQIKLQECTDALNESWLKKMDEATRVIMVHGESFLRLSKLVRPVKIRNAQRALEMEQEEEIRNKRKRTTYTDENITDDG